MWYNEKEVYYKFTKGGSFIMNFGLDSYCKQVNDIEKERNRLMVLYYSKNIFHILNRKYYKEMIDKYDELLMRCYQFIEKQIEY